MYLLKFVPHLHLHLLHARDLAAVGADVMGMTGPFVTTLIEKFKTPHVVAQIGAGGEALFGERDEVAVDRRTVEAGVGEQLIDLEVGLRAARLLQHRQHSEPRRGAPQLRKAKAGA